MSPAVTASPPPCSATNRQNRRMILVSLTCHSSDLGRWAAAVDAPSVPSIEALCLQTHESVERRSLHAKRRQWSLAEGRAGPWPPAVVNGAVSMYSDDP